MSEENNVLAALLPGRDVTCKGETIRVLPLFFGQWTTAIKILKPIFGALGSSGLFVMRTDDETKKMRFDLNTDIMSALPDLLDVGGDALMKFVAYAIAKDRPWLDTLPGDEGVELTHAILAENVDFFDRKILPMLEAKGLGKVFEGLAGTQSSLGLSTTGTTGTTSQE